MNNKKNKTPTRYRYRVTFETTKLTARTLDPVNGFIKETGWTIDAFIHEDYYTWVKEFQAFHPKHGKVKGDFESVVLASSKKAYDQFIKDHPYHEWDYGDI